MIIQEKGRIQKNIELPPVGRWGKFRRWLGIYNREEKEVKEYAKRVKQLALQVAQGKTILTSRPDWLRKPEFDQIRSLQNKVKLKTKRR